MYGYTVKLAYRIYIVFAFDNSCRRWWVVIELQYEGHLMVLLNTESVEHKDERAYICNDMALQ